MRGGEIMENRKVGWIRKKRKEVVLPKGETKRRGGKTSGIGEGGHQDNLKDEESHSASFPRNVNGGFQVDLSVGAKKY